MRHSYGEGLDMIAANPLPPTSTVQALRLPEGPRLLLIRRDNIGDLVLTTPALSLLRKRFPEAHIAALVNSYNAAVLEGNGDVDQIFVYTKVKHAGFGALGAAVGKLRMLSRVRAAHFDLAIVATAAPSPSWLQLARYSGARLVLAAAPLGTPAPRGVDICVRVDERFAGRHGAEHNVMLCEPLGVIGPPPSLKVVPDTGGVMRAREMVDSRTAPARTIGLHISARKPRQRWPQERFVQLAHELHNQINVRFVLFWSPGAQDDSRHPGDDEKADAISRACADLPLVPMATSSLRELIDGLACIDLMFCSDGGAMHLAAGLGKPVVALFGNSDPTIWRPWGVPYRVLKVSDDVSDLSVDVAVTAVMELIADVPVQVANQ